jgi:hypothetical protein
VLISPYAYDYDLPVLGIGLALLLPEIVQFGSERERATIYGLIFIAEIYGFAASISTATAGRERLPRAQIALDQWHRARLGSYSCV